MMNGRTIKKLREAMGHTQVSFAKGLGITSSTVSRWECDVIKPKGPALLFLKRLQDELQEEAAE